MVSIRNIRRKCKDYGRLRQRAVWGFWQIQCRVEFDFVAQRNLDAPVQVIVRRWLCGRWRRGWRLCDAICGKQSREHRNRKRSFHVAVLKMNCKGETRVLSCRKKATRGLVALPNLTRTKSSLSWILRENSRSAMRPRIALMVCRHASLRHDTPWHAGSRKVCNLKNRCLAT